MRVGSVSRKLAACAKRFLGASCPFQALMAVSAPSQCLARSFITVAQRRRPVQEAAPNVTRHQPPEARKRQILDAAAECFARAGYQATRMEDIAARCALSKGALYHQFDSKTAIVLALANRWVERVSAELSASDGDDSADLIAILDAPLFVVLLAESARQEELRLLLTDALLRVTQALGQRLAPQQEAQWGALTTLMLGAMVRAAVSSGVNATDAVGPASISELLKTLRSSSKPRYRVQYVDSRP